MAIDSLLFVWLFWCLSMATVFAQSSNMVTVYWKGTNSGDSQCQASNPSSQSWISSVPTDTVLLTTRFFSGRAVQFKCLGQNTVSVEIARNIDTVAVSSVLSTDTCYSGQSLTSTFGVSVSHSTVFVCRDTCIPMQIQSFVDSAANNIELLTDGLGSSVSQCLVASKSFPTAFVADNIQMISYPAKWSATITHIEVQSCVIGSGSLSQSSINVNTPWSITATLDGRVVSRDSIVANTSFSDLSITSLGVSVANTNGFSITVDPWKILGGGVNNTDLISDIVNVEEITLCVNESSEPYVYSEYSGCNAVCGEIHYQRRPSYCNSKLEGNSFSYNIYPASACGATVYPPLLCFVADSKYDSFEGDCSASWSGISGSGSIIAVAGPRSVTITWNEVDPELAEKWYITVTPTSITQQRCSNTHFLSGACMSYSVRPVQLGQPYKITGLVDGQDYRVVVELRDKWSVLSLPATSNIVTPKGLDTIVLQSPNVVPGNSQVSVNWNSPTYHGAPINTYFVKVTCNGCITQTYLATGSPKIIPNLMNAKVYTFSVKYNNTNGEFSDYGQSQTAIPRGNVRWTKPQAACSGKCGYGNIESYGQTQPKCEDEMNVTYVDSVCSALVKDTTCRRICPPAPLKVRVTATHNGALTISWDPSQSSVNDDPVEWYYVVVNFGRPNSRYTTTHANFTTTTIQGLENGIRQEIQVRSVTSRLVQSELSTSAYGIPSKTAACYGGCNQNGGICKRGICWCSPGWYGQICEDSWSIQIDYPTENIRKDMRLSASIFPGTEVEVGGGDGFAYTVSYTMYKNSTYTDKFQDADRVPLPDVLLFNKAECDLRGNKFCVPKDIKFPTLGMFHQSRSKAYTGNAQWSMSRGNGYYKEDTTTTYYTTVWISPHLNATSTTEFTLEYNEIWCPGKVQGTACTDSGITKDPARCDEFGQECVCSGYRIIEGPEGQCHELNSCGKNLVTGEQTSDDCGMFGECQTNGVCKCLEGFTTVGDSFYCNKGPNCKLKCLNGGYPAMGGPSFDTPPNDCTNTRCSCVGYFEGENCQTCGLTCANGGRPDASCSSCNCPKWFRRSTGGGNFRCEYEYQEVSFVMNIKPDPYLFPQEFSDSPFFGKLKDTMNLIFNRNGLSNTINIGEALPMGTKIKIVCSMTRNLGSAAQVVILRSLLENVKSEWYQHYMTAFTDPESLLVLQRDQGTSELNYGSVTQCISYSVLFATFLVMFLQS